MNPDLVIQKLFQSFQLQQEQMTSQTKKLVSCIQELGRKVSKMENVTHREEMENQLESRFQTIRMQTTLDFQKSNQKKQTMIKKWLGDLFKRVLSYGFKLFEGGSLNLKKTKVLCSENILSNIIDLIKTNDLNKKDIQMINNFLRQDLLPYFICKYPKSEERQVNLNFAKTISSVDNLGSNENDLISRSKVKFTYCESGVYNSKIMQFMNYLINLPQQKVALKENKSMQLGDLFHTEVQNLFKKLFDKEQIIQMKKFKKSYVRKQSKRVSEKNEMDENIAAFEYAEKVKTYTSYLISRKISKNMETFTEKQVKNGDIKIKNSAMMRVLTKWCDELEQSFNNVQKRQYPFKMEDSSEMFLIKDQTIVLSRILEREKAKITKQINEMIQNNCEQQEIFCKQNLQKELSYLSEEECKVGIFSTYMLKNNKFYLVEYLNLLIHGLLSATQKFTWFIFSKFSYDCSEDIDVFIDRCRVHFQQRKIEIKENDKKFIPSLITFKIGDLLRCKCSSKENQITALFNELERLTQEDPGFLKIIRVKNKLNTQTKNILINLLFHNTMVIEMQLAIHSDRSKFIECSDQFNHFIYELERAKFCPISQLCNIFMAFDPRAQFYNKTVKQDRDMQMIHTAKHTCHGQQKQIFFPFRCEICDVYYNSMKKKRQHKFCKVCKKNVCIYCRINGKEDYEEMRQIFCTLPPTKEGQVNKIVKLIGKKIEENIPKKGLALEIFSKQQRLKRFEKVQRQGEKFIFWEEKGKLDLLAEITKKDQLHKFLRNYIIILNNKEEVGLEFFSTINIQSEYFLTKQFQQAYRKEKQSIMINKGNIADEFLFKWALEKTFSNVKKINFRQNHIENLQNLANLFPNVQTAVLTFNFINQIPKQCKKWNHLKYLNLTKNNIIEIPDIVVFWKKLRYLNLSGNENLCKVSSQIQKLTEIQELNFNQTSIEVLPNDMMFWQNLKILVLRKTKIQNIPESISYCKQLKLLNINETPISLLPSSLCQCQNLEQMDCYQSKLERLPKNLGKLKKLQTLILAQTFISELPQSIGQCKSLQKLLLDKSLIESLPNSLEFCQELEVLSISDTDIDQFPQFLKKLTKIKLLNLSDTQIEQFPQELPNFSNLEVLYLSRMCLSTIPEFIFSLISLKQLSISKNFIKKLPKEITNLINLQSLSLYDNCFVSFPPFLNEIKKLKHVKINEDLAASVRRRGLNLQIYKVNDDIQVQYISQALSESFSFSSFNMRGRKKSKTKKKSIQDLGDVIEADLSGWDFNDLSHYLKLCTNVQNLNISKTNLKQIPWFIFQFKNIKRLVLSENYISQIPEEIGSLETLEELEIQNNCINSLPESFKNLKKLKLLKIDKRNPPITVPEIPDLKVVVVSEMSV